jgi:hypothetical protein
MLSHCSVSSTAGAWKCIHLLVGLGLLALLTSCSGFGSSGHSAPTTPPGPPAVRITLDAKGQVVLVEGHYAGNWEPSLKMATTPPRSYGMRIANIEIHEHDGSDTDLVASDGVSSAHSHSGPTDPGWAHCHLWVGLYLVHCQ